MSMKLIIQIPCYNEADTLPLTVNDLPNSIAGIDKIEIIVVNDGSTDNSLKILICVWNCWKACV